MIPKNLPSDTPQPTVVASPAWAENSVPAISDLPPCLPAYFPPYAELYSLSNFSFLRAASFPEELVEQAHELGYSALALCDECSLSGIVRAHVAAKQRGLKLLIGSVLELRVATPQAAESRHAEFSESISDLRLVLLARTRRGYGQLSHLISCARRAAAKGGYWVDRQMVEDNLPEECFALWLPHSANAAERHACQAAWLQRIFGTNLRLGVQLHLQGDDRGELRRMTQLGNRFGITLCAAGGVLMHEPSRRVLLDTLAAIRLGRALDKLGYAGEPNNERHLRDRARLAKLYPPALLAETVSLADACDFSLDELRYEYPRELVPPQYTPSGWLRELTEAGIRERWPQGVSPKVRNLIEHELGLVKELGYEHYFLTVHDIVAFARRERILCQGRGSAANSAVCYCLGITEVDPARVDVLFERFISKERDEPPDIDVDFENSRREEVIQYIYARYGRGRAALAATVITYQSRSAIRDVGKALGFDDAVLDHLSKAIYWWGENLEEQLADAEVDRADPKVQLLVELAGKLIGFPRHLSQHVGGFVISQGALTHLVPIENAAMADRTIIQWEKNDLEALGLLKIDVLALGMLSAVRKCLDLVSDYSDEPLTIQKIPAEDPAVYEMMCAADTIGVFQIESRAQMSMLPRLKPRCYYDLVIQIAIVRPGPIQGEMVHPYLNRRSGREAISYPSEAVKSVLERTLGVPIFQEQVMQLAMVAAGFSGGEADGLRRAMAAWKRKGGLEHYREKLVTGMLDRGYEPSFAEQLFNQIKGFGDYGFPESHSASFALIAYVSSWLKCYHPAAFCCALLNSQPMGFYAPAQLIKDAQRHGVEVLPAEVNESLEGCSLEAVDTVRASKATESCDSSERRKSPRVQGAEGSQRLRIGFNLVKGLSAQAAAAIVEARRGGAYVSIQDLVFRTGIDRRDLEALAAADALRGLAGDRHRAFWHAAGVITAQGYAASHSQTGSRAHSLTHSQTGSQPHSLTQADRPIADLFDDAASGDSDFGLGVMLPLASESQNV
ncbi:MAG: error-prone DNA polymerase, partial [OM182 bacterium]|nr:error-prone DNA polymerase [OM182 bacterium]